MTNIYSGEGSSFVTVNGKKILLSEYKKQMAAKRPVKKAVKKKKRETEITILMDIVSGIMKNAGPISSLAAYYDNAYRQWGNVAKEIINSKHIIGPFTKFRTLERGMKRLLTQISAASKKNDKSIYGILEMLSWKVDEMKSVMKSLYDGVKKSGVLEIYYDKECINGTERRLGLSILMARTSCSLNNMEDCVERIRQLAKNGMTKAVVSCASGGALVR